MQLLFRFFSLFLLAATFTVSVAAQSSHEVLEELRIFETFGMISDEMLHQNPDAEYPYEFLEKKTAIQIHERSRGIVAVLDHLIRIKVHSDDPFYIAEASMIGIPFYFADGIEQVSQIDGITHHANGERSFLNTNTVRTVELNNRYRILEFEMPNVQQGDVIEYKYRIERRYIEELPDIFLSHRVPTRDATVYFKNADFIRYDVVEENIDFALSYEEQRIDTSSVPLVFTFSRPDPVFIQTWKASDIPAVDALAYISSVVDIRAKLRFQISEFGLPRQPLENSWEFVAAQIFRNNNPYTFLEQNHFLLELGEQIRSETENKASAQDSIFQYVYNTVQFNGQRTVFTDNGVDHVLRGVPASQSEINMVLLGMLRGGGVDAHPIYLSGREFGRINQSFPSLFQFNRMMVHSNIDGKSYFLDASYPSSIPNLIPVDSFNEQGMILTENEYSWVEIAPERSLFSFDIEVDAKLLENGTLRGVLRANTAGYPSQQIRQKLSTGTPAREILAETFFEIYVDAIFDESFIEVNPADRDSISLSTQFEIPNYAITFSEGIEFRPMIVGYLFNNPFEPTERRVPITLDAPEMLSIRYNITLPEGFLFDVTGETYSTSLRGASLFEEYFTDGNSIEYTFNVEITRKEFPPDVYSQLRRIYERWVNLSNDTWFIELPNP
ncbi:MAG: hypothetical protein EA391_09215 [Balneolaceae bacterium]|nr:MAG: hypothetical protein EA391_09215 [Balneolaceae bacterium]